MSTATKKKVTIMLDADVYDGLRRKVGGRGIGVYLSKLARPNVVESDLCAGYKAMAADSARETEAGEWIESEFDGIDTQEVWRF